MRFALGRRIGRAGQSGPRSGRPKERQVIAGTARESTRLTVEFTNRMADLGVDAALVRPPSYFKSKMTTEALKRHYLAVADRSTSPRHHLQHPPEHRNHSRRPADRRALRRTPTSPGSRKAAGTSSFLGELIRRLPADFSYLLGHGSAFLPALLMGASGAILAVANAAPALCAKIYALFKEGRIGRGRRPSARPHSAQ